MSEHLSLSVREARASLSRVIEPGDLLGCLMVSLLGPQTAWELIRAESAPPASYQQGVAEAAERAGLSQRQRSLRHGLARWRTRVRQADGPRDLRRIRQLGGDLLIPEDAAWPRQLDELHPAAPLGLWFRTAPAGASPQHPMEELSTRMPAPHRRVAVVGAREMTDYGARVAYELSEELASHGVAIISGGAYGIDAAAHRGALAAARAADHRSAPTLAVLAGGVDRLYPAGNERLLQAISGRGLLLSELPPGASPTRHRFLHRNRIIAGLSAATVVVEARVRSGALSTANHALALSRPVGAVPGDIHSAASAGTHRLLQEAPAHLVTNALDIVHMISSADVMPTAAAAPAQPKLTDAQPLRDRLDRMSEPDRLLYDAFPRRRLITPGRLAEEAGLPVPQVLSGLTRLQANGLVRASNGEWGRCE